MTKKKWFQDQKQLHFFLQMLISQRWQNLIYFTTKCADIVKLIILQQTFVTYNKKGTIFHGISSNEAFVLQHHKKTQKDRESPQF